MSSAYARRACRLLAWAALPTLFARPGSAQPPTLDEIVVTATRVETRLQQTPMSIRALTGDELVLSGIDAGRDLGIMLPNVVLNPGPQGQSDAAMTVRGLPGVMTYVDGVWLGNPGFLQRSFAELERVEVLLGPQGTLFGRNTNGGVIQLVTRRPAREFGAKVNVQAGDLDRRDLTVAVDWPITDHLATRWTAAGQRTDGFLASQTAPLSLGDDDDRFLRGDIVWQPTEDFSLRFGANGERSRGTDARIVRISNPADFDYIAYNVLAGNPDYLDRARAINPGFPAPPVTIAGNRFTAITHESGYPGGLLGKWQTRSDTAGPTALADDRYETLTLDWVISPRLALRSLTSHRDSIDGQITDWDASEFTLRTLSVFDSTKVTTQEFQLAGNHFSGRLRTLLGLYYQRYQNWERTYRWAQWEFAMPNTGPNPGVPGTPGVDGRPLWNAAAVGYVRSWGATVGLAGLANYSPLTFATADLLNAREETERAFFGQLAIGLRPKLDLTLGFRLATNDGRFGQYLPAAAFRPPKPGTVAPGDLYAAAAPIITQEEPHVGASSTPRISLGYRPSNGVYVYASYAEGFTSSETVNNPLGATPIILGPEVVRTHELGLRSDWISNRLRLNATLFDSHWDGLRVGKSLDDPNNPGQPLGNLRIPTSDGVARSTGLEVELHYLSRTRWELDFALGLLDTQYLDIGNPPTNATGLQPGIPFQYAPNTSYSLGMRYHWPLTNGATLLATANYGWMGAYQRAAANDFQSKNPDGSSKLEPAYGILNARIVYGPPHMNWKLSLFGKNLTNQWYVNGGLDVGRYEGYDAATIGRPRELGVGIQFTFD